MAKRNTPAKTIALAKHESGTLIPDRAKLRSARTPPKARLIPLANRRNPARPPILQHNEAPSDSRPVDVSVFLRALSKVEKILFGMDVCEKP